MIRILSLGHSNRTVQQLLELLRAHDVELLLDIRRVPKSGRNPQFNVEALEFEMRGAGIRYRSVPDLGGQRIRALRSPHVSLDDPATAGYADYMDTPAFLDVGRRLIDVAGRYRTAIMCAEAKPDGCHRRLLCDWLLANGVDVAHAVDTGPPRSHSLTDHGRIVGNRVVYDCGQLDLLAPSGTLAPV